MVNHYYGIYQAERGKTSAELRAADVQVGELAARLDQLGCRIATPVAAVRRSLRRRRLAVLPAGQPQLAVSTCHGTPRPGNGEAKGDAPMQWRGAIVGGVDTTGWRVDLPCTQDPELFFAESPQDVELAKAMCRGCRIRAACLAGALERREPWGVWGGELLLRGAIVPRKRPRGRPRKTPMAA